MITEVTVGEDFEPPFHIPDSPEKQCRWDLWHCMCSWQNIFRARSKASVLPLLGWSTTGMESCSSRTAAGAGSFVSGNAVRLEHLHDENPSQFHPAKCMSSSAIVSLRSPPQSWWGRAFKDEKDGTPLYNTSVSPRQLSCLCCPRLQGCRRRHYRGHKANSFWPDRGSFLHDAVSVLWQWCLQSSQTSCSLVTCPNDSDCPPWTNVEHLVVGGNLVGSSLSYHWLRLQG